MVFGVYIVLLRGGEGGGLGLRGMFRIRDKVGGKIGEKGILRFLGLRCFN